ncbi:MATE family efflux transporter [Cetobacterium sp. 2A]|uniref:MATE family efflux transporter n=1 Tax=Cetobacterium sp. 2A TaxID=2754723 RepID=UPI00163C77BC|nr:MATE family efflux transporter [Cetobacterium sp. 2A]MBC2854922.1 MATE family efflux transporter [Cetobacterium sp. 2A]
MLKKFGFEKTFLKSLMVLAIPIILQSLITSSLNLLDNLMIGSLGENEIAAVGLSNQFYMVFFHSVMGISMGAGIFISQLWGKKDIKQIHSFLGVSLVVSLLASLFFAGLAYIKPEIIMHIFTLDETVTSLGVGYLKMVAVSYILTSISLCYSVTLRSTEQTKIPMYASLIGIVFNGVLNYLFIFGKFGAPALGVTGAAIGTTIARIAELAFILYVVYFKKNIVAAPLNSLINFNWNLIKRFFKTAFPVIFNDIVWIAGITAYSIAYAKLGTKATATMQIATTINNMFNIVGVGIGCAAAIMIGNKIGAKLNDEAYEDAQKITNFGTLSGVIMGAGVYLIAPIIAGFFKVSLETQENVVTILRIMALFVPIRFFGIIQIIGVLRGGGDVLFAILIEITAVWGIGVPLAFIGATYFKLPITSLYLLICLEEPFKVIATYPRLKSGKWIKDLTTPSYAH